MHGKHSGIGHLLAHAKPGPSQGKKSTTMGHQEGAGKPAGSLRKASQSPPNSLGKAVAALTARRCLVLLKAFEDRRPRLALPFPQILLGQIVFLIQIGAANLRQMQGRFTSALHRAVDYQGGPGTDGLKSPPDSRNLRHAATRERAIDSPSAGKVQLIVLRDAVAHEK